MPTTVNAVHSRATASEATRWGQLIFGIIWMVMIANLQYGWTLFVNPIDVKYHWGRASIQVAFTIFVLLETWLVPIEGYLVDRYGPPLVVLVGGILCGIAWAMNPYADSLAFLYFAAAVGGVGAGAVYGTCVGNALKWFPDRRGLAAGLTAAGFGMGSAPPLIVFLVSFGLRAPRKGDVPEVAKVAITHREYTWKEMIKTPVFWVMY